MAPGDGPDSSRAQRVAFLHALDNGSQPMFELLVLATAAQTIGQPQPDADGHPDIVSVQK